MSTNSEPIRFDTAEGGDEAVEQIALFAVPNPAHAEWAAKAPSKRSKTEPEEFITYSMPAEVNPVVGLEYGDRVAVNAAAANSWLIREVVGDAAYAALTSELKKMAPKRATAMLRAVAEKVTAVVLGN